MKSFRHRLPPLHGLLVFEAAARHLNFTRAARELHVTQGAVSRQVQQLEARLGVALFERRGRTLALSDAGRELHARVSASLHFLVEALDDIALKDDSRSITLAANTAMSHLWLGPALNAFRHRNPDEADRLRVITSDRTDDLLGDEVDIAIIYDVNPGTHWQVADLFEEELFPVASPSYRQQHDHPADTTMDLCRHALLDFERIEPNWINWRLWFSALGESVEESFTPFARFTNYGLLIDAAEQGQGVALGTRWQIDAHLARGSLIRLGRLSVRTGRHYRLARNRRSPDDPRLEALHDWLCRYRVETSPPGAPSAGRGDAT